jgi:hypothetical protein
MGVLSDLLRERFKIKTRPLVNPLVAAVGLAAIPIAQNNPDRVGFVMINLSANIVYISPLDTVLATAGIRLDANGGQVSMVWDEDFELVSQPWYGIATGAGSAVFILEIIGQQG